ncbi:major facilitator superfamily domain-containing protein [Lophiotrema nucula]|uniref:Major facilitator superfamily domain-containing protein n=1 Tax=Lophiotrema nucula TaxID=690887 RepID=A0A6A5YSD9_9PLEO|nr:major facilitator superfamily domain-containing protein [Lophiotrema nucula]
MATPASYANPASEARDLDNEKLELAYEEGHDADIPSNLGTYNGKDETNLNVDLEKGVRSKVGSAHTDERTLGEDVSPTDEQEGESNPNIVDWDGPDDPQNPQNWTSGRKWGLVAALSATTLITPLASSFFAPGVPQVMASFHETSNLLAAFVVSVYILGFAIGPLIIAPLSELYGRMILYNICNVFFIIFTVACAVSTNMNMLIGFRFLAGCAGSSPLTLGGGTIADIMPREKRAGAMAIWGMGPLLGPVIGPVCAGYLVDAKGWRWVFWILTIFGSFFSLILLAVGRETYAPVLLERKAARLRKETGNQNLRSKMAIDIPASEIFKRSIVRPMKMLFTSPIVFLMSFYVAVNYGVLYLLFTTITFVFEDQYHFSTGSVGLSYLGAGIGMIAGMAVLGVLSDKIIKKQMAKGNVKPEHRLPLIITLPGALGLPVGLFMYGWCADKGVHWIAPIIGTGLVGLGNLTGMMTIQTYLVDAFTLHAASAIAANTVLRSVFGAVLPLAGLDMYAKLGLGWGNSLLGFVALVLIPVPVFFRFYGERIRTRFQVQF